MVMQVDDLAASPDAPTLSHPLNILYMSILAVCSVRYRSDKPYH